KAIRGLDQADLLTALASVKGPEEEKARDFILGSMSKRLAEGMQEEIGELGKVKEKDGDAAKGALVAEIRRLEAAGEIHLVANDDED
ncbi:MAG: FliG C-terminal domain-containing protein, partial [Pseudomonadota bacterium]